jgi:hypothetical protein
MRVWQGNSGQRNEWQISKPACAVNPLDHYPNTLFPCPHSFANHLPFLMMVWQRNECFKTALAVNTLDHYPNTLFPYPHSFANHLPFVMRVWQE